jgi:hypothetical protein
MAGEVFVVENMRRSSRYRVQGGFPTRRDGGCACQWRPAIRAPVDVSQTSELLSSLHCTTEHFRPLGFFFRTPALHILSTMASRRTCINVLSRLEGISSRATGASPSLRTFSSKSSNWTCATRRGINEAKRRTSPCLEVPNMVLSPILQARRQFSSTPTPRHGHLDAPKPGEE